MSGSAFALPAGTRIAGYEIMDCIGAGGFGITYTGYNRVTDRRVAIKEFFPQGIASRSARSTELVVSSDQEETLRWALHKFETTTKDLSRLSHPNIVRVIDYYPGNNTAYMIMEYLHGQTIEDWLAERATPPRPSELAPLLEPVLDALEYLHGLGLIHRDVAPDNIFLCQDGRPVLIDFGAASQDRSMLGTTAEPTVTVRKRSYSAPDQSRGTSLPNPTADVYSFGAVLFHALSGRPPADGEERMSDILIAGRDPYRPLEAALPAATSRRMGRAIDLCLSLEAHRRPDSIRSAKALFDWRDDTVQDRTVGPRPEPKGGDAFSRDQDVISRVMLDDPIFDRERASSLEINQRPSVPTGPAPGLPASRRPLVAVTTLVCGAVGVTLWLWFLH